MKSNDRYRIDMIALMVLPFGILFVLLIIDPLFHAASGIFLLIYANAGLIGAAVISRYYHLKLQRQIT